MVGLLGWNGVARMELGGVKRGEVRWNGVWLYGVVLGWAGGVGLGAGGVVRRVCGVVCEGSQKDRYEL